MTNAWTRSWQQFFYALVGIAITVSALVSSPVFANQELVKQNVETWLKGRHKVDEIRKTALANMYEVRFGTELIYVDDKGQFAFLEGVMFDLKNDRNLTQERKDWIGRVDFKSLPLDLAIKQVNGKGTGQLVVFEDPNCGHCRNMRRELMKLEDTTVYTYVLPILAADSATKIKQVLCSRNKLAAWNDLMVNGKTPGVSGDCAAAESELKKLVDLGAKLNVTGTPTLLFTSGRRVPGSVPLQQVRKFMTEKSMPEPS